MSSLLPTAAIAVLAYMTAAFILAQALRNNGLVDVAWGPGFIVLTAALWARTGALGPVQTLMTAAVVLWGLRLSVHIALRNWGRPEDFRYAAMRKKWGRAAAVKAFFFVFMLQGLIMLVVSLPITVVFAAPARPLGVLDAAGALVFLAGFLFETVGDAQLVLHRADPARKGRLMTTGLWSSTRHPNYFGEALLWWGLGLIALGSRHGAAGLVGPALMSVLLVFVSGVPLLEKKYAGRPDWEAYKARTPMFVPWFPKKGGA